MSLRLISHPSPESRNAAAPSARGAFAAVGRWAGLGLTTVVMTLVGSTGCGDDEKCPRGTTGNPCRFDSDVGLAPTSPPWVNDVSLDVETQTPDIGPEPDGTSESRSRVFGDDSSSQVAWLGQSAFGHRSPAAGSDLASSESHPYETPNAHIDAGHGPRDPARTHADAQRLLGWMALRDGRVPLVIPKFHSRAGWPSQDVCEVTGPDERQSSGA